MCVAARACFSVHGGIRIKRGRPGTEAKPRPILPTISKRKRVPRLSINSIPGRLPPLAWPGYEACPALKASEPAIVVRWRLNKQNSSRVSYWLYYTVPSHKYILVSKATPFGLRDCMHIHVLLWRLVACGSVLQWSLEVYIMSYNVL